MLHVHILTLSNMNRVCPHPDRPSVQLPQDSRLLGIREGFSYILSFALLSGFFCGFFRICPEKNLENSCIHRMLMKMLSECGLTTWFTMRSFVIGQRS